MKLNWSFQKGGAGLKQKKSILCGRYMYGCFLELHSSSQLWTIAKVAHKALKHVQIVVAIRRMYK